MVIQYTITTSSMKPDSKIYIAGHRGLVGSALMRRLDADGYKNIITHTHADLDLTKQAAVDQFFAQERPEYVFLSAAKVGGILANDTYRADFIYQNLMIEANVIDAAYRHGTKKLLFLGSSCIYPVHAPQPMKEEYLLSGQLEPTNEAYAIAKIVGVKMCAAYNRQYGTNFLSVMPTNVYGPGDNYNLETSHVVPALIRKAHEAKVRGEPSLVVWGTGKPLREFLYSDDLADACIFLMHNYSAAELGEFVNIGVGEDLSVQDLAQLVAEVVGFSGTLVFNPDMPDGAPQKLLDSSRLLALGWKARTSLSEGLRLAYQDFLAHHCN